MSAFLVLHLQHKGFKILLKPYSTNHFHKPFVSVKPRKVNNLRYHRTPNLTTIIWNPLEFGDCDADHEYIIEMYHNKKTLFIKKTVENYFYCETECAHATSFKIWTVVNNQESNYTRRLFDTQKGNVSQ